MIEQKAKNTIASSFGSFGISRDGINVSVSCPDCDPTKKKKKLSIRLDDFRYHCWVCGIKGKSIWRYISRKFPHIQIDENLEKITSSNLLDHEDDEQESNTVDLPENIYPVFRDSLDPDLKCVRNYLLKRGLTLRDMARWRIMTASSGRFRRRALVPSFDVEGDVNYYVGRSIDSTDYKYINASVSKKEIIFNEIDINWDKTVVLVEGVFDAMKSVSNTIPILGSTLSHDSRLFKTLMKNRSDVIVSLDPDLKDKAYKIAESLYTAGCSVRICFPPKGVDMGDRDVITNKKMLESSKMITPYSRLSYRIKEIKSGSII